jgi:hypothetical protein
MRTVNPHTDHWVSTPRRGYGSVIAYGVSSWDMPDGARLRREMSRSTLLDSIKAMKKWARRYKLDVTRQIAEWDQLEARLKAEALHRAVMGS